jgi:regulator of replication initiation timing
MKKSIFIIVLFFTYITSAYALFDSKKVKELEQENATLKKENTTLRAENNKMKKDINRLKQDPSLYQILMTAAEEEAERESKAIPVAINTVEIIQADFDSSDLGGYYPKIYANIKVKNKNKFSVRLNITVEVRGQDDKQQFIYEKHNITGYLNAGETKMLTEDFHIDDDSVKAGYGATFNAIITEVVKY